MGSRVIVQSFCDGCGTESADALIAGHTLRVDDFGPSSLDLCETCRGKLVDDLVELLRTVVPPQASKRRGRTPIGGSWTCEFCDYTGASKHLLNMHTGRNHRELVPLTHVCPECGAGTRSAAGLATHRRLAHPDSKDSNAAASS